MLSFLLVITISTIFYLLFSFLLGALNQSMLQLFVPIQKLTNRLKRKKLYSNLTLVFLITICAGISENYKINDIKYGILLGFFFTLRDVIFDDLIGKK